jgi:transcriptional regulator with XRE-family HTH domain
MHWMYKPFGRRVRELRETCGLTQAKLADSVGLSRTSITNIERGRQAVPLHALYSFAESLKVELIELLPEPSERANARTELERVFEELTAKQLTSVRKILDARSQEGG